MTRTNRHIGYLGTTVRITADRGTVTDAHNWQHRSYRLQLSRTDATGALVKSPAFDWRQGMGITTAPTADPDAILEALLSDAQLWASSDGLADFAANIGMDADDYKEFRTAGGMYRACQSTHEWLTEYLTAPHVTGDPLEALSDYLEAVAAPRGL